MKFEDKISGVQKLLQERDVDGWLFYDFGGNNPHAWEFLELPKDTHATRRFFYFIPKKGVPTKIVHRLEPAILAHLPHENQHLYSSWKELDEELGRVLENASVIAMEYSPRCEIPAVSSVDAGTIELVKEAGALSEVISSAPFLQPFTCVLSQNQLRSHKNAAEFLEICAQKAWAMIRLYLEEEREISEWDVQQMILSEMEKNGFETAGAPIVAVNANGANPHYCPTKENHAKIRRGDVIMLDQWCREKEENAVFADMTRMGFAGSPDEIPAEVNAVFDIVKEAQETALRFIRHRFENGEVVKGFEADEQARDLIKEKNYGAHFIHRLGHNLYTKSHGPGAHLDSFETLDTRPLIKGSSFTIEPGIYLEGKFGVRLECDCYIHENGEVEVTCGGDQKLETLF